MIFSALASALITFASSPAVAKETLWSPTDFKGAWVSIIDKAENGCWTNIGEVKTYAADQLELAGFKVVEEPEVREGETHPIITDDLVMLVIRVKGTRWSNDLCVGDVSAYFLGSVAPRHELDALIVNPIGIPGSAAVWDMNNFNTFVLDQIKVYVSQWVQSGRISKPDE